MPLLTRRLLLQAATSGAAAALPALLPPAAVAATAHARRRPHGKHARKRPLTIVIDPGHGGEDPGAIGLHGEREKDIVFAAAKELVRQLERRRRYRVVMTRTHDVFVPLHERVVRAHAARADLFLSLHANTVPDAKIRGLSVFTLSEQASDRLAAALAATENAADLIIGLDISKQPRDVGQILIDLARRQTDNLSNRLARRLLAELEAKTRLLTNAHRSAGFAVLKSPDIPSALIEIGCLSNPADAHLLRQSRHRRALAAAIARATDVFFSRIYTA